MPVLGLCLDNKTLRLLAVVHGKCGVGLKGYLLLEGVLVQGKLLLIGRGFVLILITWFCGFSCLIQFS